MKITAGFLAEGLNSIQFVYYTNEHFPLSIIIRLGDRKDTLRIS